jgi:hypothetical protein
MARSKRKRCKVYVEKTGEVDFRHGKPVYGPTRVRCEAKIKPGTPFCKEHFETHKLIVRECNGEAHSNPYIDNCGVCMPFWGSYPVAVPKDAPGEPWTREWE